MGRAEVLQGVRQMRFEALLDRRERDELNQEEAGEMLGISERTFRGWRDRRQSARRIAASCLSVVPRRLRCSRSKTVGYISRLGRFISRLGGGNSRFARLRELVRKRLIGWANFWPNGPGGATIRDFSRGTGNCPKSGRGGTSGPVATASRHRRV